MTDCGPCPSLGRWRNRGEQGQSIGRSRGGRTTKIHALCDGAARLYRLILTPGQVHDIRGAEALMAIGLLPKCLIGDKAYDSGALRTFLKDRNSIAAIPPKASWHALHYAQVVWRPA